MTGEQKSRGWWGRNWVWVVPVGCLTPIVVCGGGFVLIFTLVFGAIKSSDAYQGALTRAQADARVVAALGSPVEGGLLVTGNINVSGSTGHADLSIPISGPNGSAMIYAAADKSAGQWQYTTLDVVIDGTDVRIDLLPGL